MGRLYSGVTTRTDRERGEGLVELPLILPVLLLMVMAVIDFGRAVYAYSVVANCAREGARYGLVAPTDTNGVIAVVRAASVGLDLNELTVTVSHPTSDSIRVHVSYDFELITPMVAQIVSDNGTIALSSTTTMYTGY